MILVSKTYWSGAPWFFRKPPADAAIESLALRAPDARQFRALYWTQRANVRPRTAVVCMHPRVDFTQHYVIPRLVEAGIGCLAANGRHLNNDMDTEHEDLLLDLATCITFLRERRGVERVLLLGNSGGGSLSAFYQAQARLAPEARLDTTPGGSRTWLRVAPMPLADALILIACHRGQGQVLLECIDPSVIDENDPHATDPGLDMYDTRNGFAPPPAWSEYSPDFVSRYRKAQRERVQRLDARALELIRTQREARGELDAPDFANRPFEAQQMAQRRAAYEPLMVVHRTMANLNYTDRRLDPSPREYGSLVSERPDLMNMALLGFARVVTPRAWLSTWSGLSTNADLVTNLATVQEPTLFVHAGLDREIYPRTDAEAIASAIRADDRTVIEMADARHYFEPPFGETSAPDVERLMNHVVPWIRERFAG